MVTAWGAVCRPKEGQSISGDIYVYQEYGDGQILAALIDGLGGGSEAARAAQGAADIFQRHPDQPLQQLIRSAHQALMNTRGAVVGLLRLDTHGHKATYVGVGNIGIYVQSTQQIKPISRNGIVGARMPTSLLEMPYSYLPGDTFVLYSDGISTRWSIDGKLDLRLDPQVLAETVLASYGKLNDDATVLVVRPA